MLVSAVVKAEDHIATRLVLSVTDNGVGISEEHMARIFEPFVQVDGSMTRKAGGAGLGLSICRCLAELMGGQISATSALGQGSTFSVTVPVTKPDQQEPVHPKPAQLQNLHVLIADDAPGSLRTLHEYLLSWGMRPGQEQVWTRHCRCLPMQPLTKIPIR